MRVEIPNGRTPPDWVYRYSESIVSILGSINGGSSTCLMPAMCLVIYSIVTGSSTVKRWLWHSIRALSISTRPSALRPMVTINLTVRVIRNRLLTGESKTDMIVEHDHFTDGTRILKLKYWFLLHTQHHDIFSANSNCTCALTHGLRSIFNLYFARSKSVPEESAWNDAYSLPGTDVRQERKR